MASAAIACSAWVGRQLLTWAAAACPVVATGATATKMTALGAAAVAPGRMLSFGAVAHLPLCHQPPLGVSVVALPPHDATLGARAPAAMMRRNR